MFVRGAGVCPPPFFDETERGEGDIIRRRAGPPAAAPVFCFCLGGRGGGYVGPDGAEGAIEPPRAPPRIGGSRAGLRPQEDTQKSEAGIFVQPFLYSSFFFDSISPAEEGRLLRRVVENSRLSRIASGFGSTRVRGALCGHAATNTHRELTCPQCNTHACMHSMYDVLIIN